MFAAQLERLTHHCHIVESDNESYCLQHSRLAAQAKIKSRERKRKGGLLHDWMWHVFDDDIDQFR